MPAALFGYAVDVVITVNSFPAFVSVMAVSLPLSMIFGVPAPPAAPFAQIHAVRPMRGNSVMFTSPTEAVSSV